MSIEIVILAAGQSSRFNDIKALAEYQSKTLLSHAIQAASNSNANKVNIILGAHRDKILSATNLDAYNVIYNPEYASGMASSIKLGVNKLQDSKALLLMTVDQPLVTSTDLNKLIKLFNQSENNIVASHYAMTSGIPAIFPQKYYSDLMQLTGDQGAKKLLTENNTQSVSIPGAEFDIDRAEDLQRLSTSR